MPTDLPELPEDLVTPREAAALLRVHLSTLYDYLHTGRLRGWQRGARWLIRRADLAEMLRPFEPAPRLRTRREADLETAQRLERAGIRG